MNRSFIKMALISGLVVAASVSATPSSDEPVANEEVMLVAVYNPNNGKVEYRTCVNFPDCDGADLKPPPSANTDVNEDKDL